MSNELSGLNVIVTGASSGIGRACALEFGGAGSNVLVNCFDEQEQAEHIAAAVREAGGGALALCADVADEEQVMDLFRRMTEEFGTVDLLVNNAGIQKDVDFVDMSLDDWNAVLGVNLTGQFLCAREAAREFLREDRPRPATRCLGNIINMSSVHEAIPWAGHVNYATAKGGSAMLTRTLAQELAPRGVRVNAVAPGAIKTAINEEVWSDEEGRRKMLELIPYDRIGEVEDVAAVVRWLASDASDYVIGTTLFVDGGMMLYPGFREGG